MHSVMVDGVESFNNNIYIGDVVYLIDDHATEFGCPVCDISFFSADTVMLSSTQDGPYTDIADKYVRTGCIYAETTS